MIARHKKPRHDLIVVLHSKSCDAAEKVVARLLKTRDHRGADSTVTVKLGTGSRHCFAQLYESGIKVADLNFHFVSNTMTHLSGIYLILTHCYCY